jgi:hypothetical protein
MILPIEFLVSDLEFQVSIFPKDLDLKLQGSSLFPLEGFLQILSRRFSCCKAIFDSANSTASPQPLKRKLMPVFANWQKITGVINIAKKIKKGEKASENNQGSSWRTKQEFSPIVIHNFPK